MIPIYEEITKRLSLPENKGKIYGSENNNFNEVHHLVHAFSCTAIASDVADLHDREGGSIDIIANKFFLPFDKIFISTIFHDGSGRIGFYCQNNGDYISIHYIWEFKNEIGWSDLYSDIQIVKHATIKNCYSIIKEKSYLLTKRRDLVGNVAFESIEHHDSILADFFYNLAFINSPGVIDATAKPPSLSAQRYFRSHGMYPFKAVTEIKIKPGVAYTPGKGKSPLRRSGGVCRHEVRSHERRLHDGRITIVRSHPRGDEKYGVKKSRYNVVPPRGGGASVGV